MGSADSLAAAFARAARVALAGMLVPQAAAGLIAGWGAPLRSGVSLALLLGGLAGFAGAGALAGRATGRGGGATAAFALAFALAGGLVVPAAQSLQGLTGREPLVVMVPVITAAFATGFGLAGLVASMALGAPRRLTARIVASSLASGAAGGIIALVPAFLARAHLRFDGAAYLTLFVAVASYLASVILPFRLVGGALERVPGAPVPRDGLGLGR